MDRPEFVDKERGEEFLERMSSADDPFILDKLISWVDFMLDELMPNIGNDANSATFTASTASALSEMITPFTMTVPYPSFEGTKLKCCPWPLVKKVRITFNSRILGQGIIIGDLPGTSDKIRSRVDSTKRYLQTCDISIVVNRLERAIDHEAFVNQINEAFKRRRSGSIIVVCTRSDDLQKTSKQSFAYTPAEEGALLEISNEEFRITKKIQDLKDTISTLKAKKHAVEKFQLMQKKETMLRKKHKNSLRRFELRVQARNRHVKSSIAEGYRLETKDRAPLPIFTVSNTVHNHYLKGYNNGDPPELSLYGTEIPQLREAIYSIPSTGRFSSLEHYCRFRLPEFLNTVEISCTVSKLKRKELLMKTFHKSREILRQTVESRAEDFRVMEFDAVHVTIIKNELKWTNKARARCNKWKDLPAASHRSVVRHQGEWKTKKIDAQHWNNELLKPVASDLEVVFEGIHDDVCDQFTQDISERVGEAVTKLSTALDGEPAASLSGALKAFRDNLQQRRKDIDRACEKFRKEIKREVRKLHVRATTDSPDHYFTEAMKPVYAAADQAPKSRNGTLHTARCAAFASLVCAVGEESVFLQISQGLRDDFDIMFSKLIEDFINVLDRVFARTQHDVDAVCSTKEDDSPEAKRVREDLLAMLPEARALLADKIWTHLDQCRAK